MRKILITGGAGFIGSHMVLKLYHDHSDCIIMNIDKLSYASNLNYINTIPKDSLRYHFKKLDIANKEAIRNVIIDYQPEIILHFAAESHVDNSIQNPEHFIQSNIVGTYNMLETCRHLWLNDSFKTKTSPLFLHVSTDEVYGSLGTTGSSKEGDPYLPNSPYSASKASSDLLVRAYHKTYNLPTITTHCTNNYGPHQHDEKLIPTIIRNALKGNAIPIYGQGKNVRDWLYVKSHCDAISLLIQHGKIGDTYNIAGNNEWKNVDIVYKICDILSEIMPQPNIPSYRKLITFVKDRPGHDLRYSMDTTHIKDTINWQYSTHQFDNDLRHTIKWYINKYKS